jgi:hypothetical protein
MEEGESGKKAEAKQANTKNKHKQKARTKPKQIIIKGEGVGGNQSLTKKTL